MCVRAFKHQVMGAASPRAQRDSAHVGEQGKKAAREGVAFPSCSRTGHGCVCSAPAGRVCGSTLSACWFPAAVPLLCDDGIKKESPQS